MSRSPVSILVIENHPLMREALCTAIAAEADLCVAQPDITSAEAVTISIMHELLFLPCNPDIILLALGNPGLSELETLKALRKLLPITPILALTSNEVPGQEKAALQAGAQAVLTKAAPRCELLHTLRALAAPKQA